MIRLYIDNKLVDLSADIAINMNYTSVEASNPTAIKNSFSKTIKLPGTKRNNELFGHIYRLDRNLVESNNLTGIYFDARRRVTFSIHKNGVIIESGYIQLNNIEVQNTNISYNITLYGGLGDFFYNLMYNSDGEERTLADLYYNWIPVNSLSNYLTPLEALNPEQEASQYIIRWSSDILGYGFSLLSATDTKRNPTYITEDITIVPVYQGKYEDFESDTMAINTTGFDSPYIVSEEAKNVYNTFFPTSITTDNTYSVVSDTDSSAKWSIVKMPREIEPYEARDLRITNQNIAIKLSKLFNAISDPYNNGGYQVEWDQDILDSPYWKYTWIMLGKPDWEISQSGNYDTSFDQLPLGVKTQIHFTPPAVDLTSMTNPKLHLNYKDYVENKFTLVGASQNISDITVDDIYYGPIEPMVNSAFWTTLSFSDATEYEPIAPTNYYFNSIVTQIDIYDGSTYKSSYTTLKFNDQQNSQSTYGSYKGTQIIPTSTITSNLITYLNSISDFNTITDFDLVENKQMTIEFDRSKFTTEKYYLPRHYELYTADMDYQWSINSIVDIPLSNTISNLQVYIKNYYIQYKYNIASDTYEISLNNDKLFTGLISFYCIPQLQVFSNAIQFFSTHTDKEHWNAVVEAAAIDELKTARIANKKNILGTTDSPYDYLTNFTKILNLKYEYDPINKKISIKPLKKYYQNNIIDITDQIDYSKRSTITPVFTDKKYIEWSLNTPDTYVNYLYKKKNKQPYASYKFDTKTEFNSETEQFVKESIMNEVIPYQLSSQYIPSYTTLIWAFYPTPLMAGTFDYILYKNGDPVEDKANFTMNTNYITVPNIRNNINQINTDTIPKLCCFDKDQENVSDCKNNFIFLNGFVRNCTYDYYDRTNNKQVCNSTIHLTDDCKIVNEKMLGDSNCYIYSATMGGPSDDQIGTYDSDHNCFLTYGWKSDYSWAPFILPYFSKIHTLEQVSKDEWGLLSTTQPLRSWELYKPAQKVYDESSIELMKYVKPLPNIVDWSDQYLDPVIDEYFDRIYKRLNITDYQNNENIYIYNNYWKDYIEDMYNKNTKEVTVYARIDDEPRQAMKNFYYFDGAYWIISKIENFDILSDYRNEFHKITFIKVQNISNYTNQ